MVRGIGQKNTDKISVYSGAAEFINVPDEHADIVLCSSVFIFTDQQKALAEMSRILKPGGTICIIVNGIGYFLRYIKNGIKYGDYSKAFYGVSGLISTLLKWKKDMKLPYPKAVSVKEIKTVFSKNSLNIKDIRLFAPNEEFSLEDLGFPSNYAFTAQKRK